MFEDGVCETCEAGGRCGDCFGAGHEPDRPADTCLSCGGRGEELPMLPTCSSEEPCRLAARGS